MKTRRLGNTDLELTTIGLGTWAIGGGNWDYGWGPQDEKAAVDTVAAACELGINWIDTAPVYGAGQSEEMVGKGLRVLRERGANLPYVATKFGRINQPDGSVTGDISRESIFREVDDSLRRLGVDCIDLYQMHWPKPDAEIESAWEAVCELLQTGKIRYAGVSNFSVSQLERVSKVGPVASLQPPYSLIVPDVKEEVLPYCAQHELGVIAYSPMYKGLLTGAFDSERIASLDASDHRLKDPHFQSPLIEKHLELVSQLRPIAARNEKSLAELAIAWVLYHPTVTSAIVGARRPEQIQQTVGAGDWQLSDADAEEIAGLLG